MIALETRYGFRFDIRLATHQDEPALADFFAEVTDEDRRFRFLSAVRQVSPGQLHAMTDFAYHRHESFLAFTPDGHDIIAAATLAVDEGGDTGEVAITILPDHKGKGIGWTLLDHVAQEARAWGVTRLQSIESRDNRAAISLEREMGFSAKAIEGDPGLVLLERAF
ncbi:GNAT family N-acetyltransferase [Sphingobium sp. CAP-1]|uniref:GNAT family N-acetyltransferase n=1 Tax=Sphingobium sp. CAP-1 TaxID=2676077 RepID=UPI0012BB2478|nr:GNAT family N-acetyltransferase [Sphingobium sp. CAP-1]QGP79082.1 GNAT family N-acetyltransferase [Sphingobium sp. CAP-1]